LRPEVAAGACSSPVVRSSRRQWAAGVRIMCHRGHGLAVRVRRNVISTERKDHIATVITDSGQRVTVLGTEGGFPESFRSTDRRYALGGLYEFHPLNGESPYRDNICTATQQLAGSAASAVAASERFLARLASHRRTSRICGISALLRSGCGRRCASHPGRSQGLPAIHRSSRLTLPFG
jgi:hypothetical protein